MSRISIPGFVVVLALLPCAAAAQRDPPAQPPVAAPPAGTSPVQAPSFALPPLDELHATRERPLFSPQRKPDVEAAPESEPQVVQENPDALPFELTGVVMGADVAIAILRHKDTQETVHLRQGEKLEAWSIDEISARQIILRQDERQMTLELFPAKADASAGTPQPAAFPQPRITPAPPPVRVENAPPRRNSQLQNGQPRNLQTNRPQQRRGIRRPNQSGQPQNR
jgi:hypothetical protein